MKTLNKKSVQMFLGLVFALLLLGIAGTMDRTEEIIYNMPDSTYHTIKAKLSVNGDTPSEYEIATYYLDHYGK